MPEIVENPKYKKSYRKFLIKMLVVSIIFFCGFFVYYVNHIIPGKINLVAGQSGTFDFNFPLQAVLESESEEVLLSSTSNIPSNEVNINLKNSSFNVQSDTSGTYQLSLKILGITVKDIEVAVNEEAYVIPCGIPVGLYLETDGIMVVGTSELTDVNGNTAEPALGILKSGDYIIKMNNTDVTSKEMLAEMISDNGNNPALLTIRRNDELLEVKINPVCIAKQEYKLGIWIRDDVQGIGTLSFIDSNGNFAALGHSISDTDTGQSVEISGGTLYPSKINSIQKGSSGSPGSLAGTIQYIVTSKLGDIEENTACGVYGEADDNLYRSVTTTAVPIAYKQEVETGTAQIYCTVDGTTRLYDVEITRIDYNSKNNKGIILKVTDPELLALTGGIVQGMSGSPILQNGKMIGAVTHVFVDDATQGYGIFLETMLEEMYK